MKSEKLKVKNSNFACKFEMYATKAETFRCFVGTHSLR